MPSPTSTRTRTVGLGRKILGDKAFEKEQRTGNQASIVLGPKLIGKKKSREEVKKLEEVRTKAPDPATNLKVVPPGTKAAAPAPQKAPAAQKAAAPTKPTSAPKKAVTKVTAPPAPAKPKPVGGMTEVQARKLLKGDPDGWDKVLEVETKRPGGIRPAVARAIVSLAPLMTKNPLPDEMKKELENLAGAAPVGPTQ